MRIVATATLLPHEQPPQKAARPTANLTSGEVEKGALLILSTTTSGATIYYTTDGTCPAVEENNRFVYNGPIEIHENVLIIATAYRAGMEYSDRIGLNFTVREKVNGITVNGINIALEVVNGTAVLTPTQEQMAVILNAAGNNVVFDLSGFSSVDIFFDTAVFKDTDKTIIFITDSGRCEVKTKTLWNNSGKQRLITIRNNRIDVKNL